LEQNIYSAILRLITTRQDDIKSVLIDGNVENWDRYQFLVGQLTSLRKLDSDVRDLYRKWEVDDDVDNGADYAQRKKDSGDKSR
jgi:hypothetical protein